MRRLHPDVDLDVDVESSYDDERPAPSGRPYVLVNMVSSADGAVAVDGRTKAMSSPADASVFHLLRSIPDVILVGAQTVRAEHYGPPRVNDERQARRLARGQSAQPTIAVVTRSLQLDVSSPLFSQSRPIVICPTDVDVSELAEVADVVQDGEGDVDLTGALRQLRQRGVGLVLCEGGPTLNGDLARHGLIDELCLTVAPLLVGGDLGTGILGRARLPRTLPLELAQVLEEGGVLLCRYKAIANHELATATAVEAAETADGGARSAFHAAMAQLDMPMQIVTAADPVGGERGGCLVGFAAQCSIEPPRFMVWLSKKNHTLRIARRAEVLAVHFPTPDQLDVAERFGTRSGDDVDKLASERWHEGPQGVPILDDVPRWFAGRVTERLDSGDHVAFMLEPIDGSVGADDLPQLGFQAVKHLRPGHDA
ncbi:MAG: dihydrofolate reductase family protein [Actinobacteria bacterium]|nr:dihydrofolate reductase family protein [Actinomycetota bacterium]